MNALKFPLTTHFIALLLVPPTMLHGAEPAPSIHETFDTSFDATRFLTPIPNKNTEVCDGVLWTHGSSGGKYPPMVYLPVQGMDLTISFRYRHLAAGGWLLLLVDGDDGFGSEDHMLRVKLLRDGVQLQVDAHSKGRTAGRRTAGTPTNCGELRGGTAGTPTNELRNWNCGNELRGHPQIV